eukprot:m.193022 g.193022  ORF g.193022 m.193022 type:complete len:531 (+) comp17592_c0_seq9:3457-5049(+)
MHRLRVLHEQSPLGIGREYRQVLDADIQAGAEATQQEEHAEEEEKVGRPRLDGIALVARQLVQLGHLLLAESFKFGAHFRSGLGVAQNEADVPHVLEGVSPLENQAHHVKGAEEAAKVHVGCGGDHGGKSNAVAVVQGLDQAVVEEDRAHAAGDRVDVDQNVARVRVGVEEAGDKDLVGKGLADALDDGGAVNAQPLKLLHLRHLEALHKVHHHHRPRDEMVHRQRHENVNLRRKQVLRHPPQIVCLLHKVKLVHRRLGVLGDDGLEVKVGLEICDPAHDALQVDHVLAHEGVNVLVLHLHHDRPPVLAQRGFVHLGNRRRGHRRWVKGREELGDRNAQLAHNLCFDGAERARRQLVLQRAEALHPDHRHDVAACAEILADLDPEALEVLDHAQDKAREEVVQVVPARVLHVLGHREPAAAQLQQLIAAKDDNRHRVDNEPPDKQPARGRPERNQQHSKGARQPVLHQPGRHPHIDGLVVRMRMGVVWPRLVLLLLLLLLLVVVEDEAGQKAEHDAGDDEQQTQPPGQRK